RTPPSSQTYTPSLHDALPISYALVAPHLSRLHQHSVPIVGQHGPRLGSFAGHSLALAVFLLHHLARQRAVDLRHRRPVDLIDGVDRKSTRLNSSHVKNSYAVF